MLCRLRGRRGEVVFANSLHRQQDPWRSDSGFARWPVIFISYSYSYSSRSPEQCMQCPVLQLLD